MCFRDGVLGETPVRSHHLVESGDAVSGLEFHDIAPDGVDDAGDVVARVEVVALFRPFPIFRVGAGKDNFDRDLVLAGRWDGGVDDGDFGPFGDNCFLHGGRRRLRDRLRWEAIAEMVE